MALGDLSISYEGTSITFDKFSDESLPRAYLSQATLDFTQIGVGYSTGPAKRQRKIWTVAAYVTQQEVTDVFTLFNAWDDDRSNGQNDAQVTIQDELFGTTINAVGFFTEPPAVTKLGPGNDTYYLISFALTEV